eukprot:6047800-Lingulodinium_polyedra.AAC.1
MAETASFKPSGAVKRSNNLAYAGENEHTTPYLLRINRPHTSTTFNGALTLPTQSLIFMES